MATRGPGAVRFVLAVPALSLGLSAAPPTFGEDSAARVLVKFRARTALVMAADRAGASRNVARAVALSSRVGLRLEAGASVSELAQVVFASGVTSAELAARLSQEADVEYAVPDERRRIVAAPRDPLYAEGVPGNGPAAGQWYLRAPAGEVSSSLNVEPAWTITTGSPKSSWPSSIPACGTNTRTCCPRRSAATCFRATT